MGEEITYTTLRNRQQREEKPGLTRLAPDFYRRARQRIAELREEYEQAHAEGSSHQRTMVLLDEVSKMEETLEELYHLRERKVVQMALTKARGGDPDVDNLTPVEEDLFERIVDLLAEHEERTLESPSATPDPREDPTEPPEREGEDAPSAPEEDEGDDDRSDEGDDEEASDQVDRVLVRVLEDLEPFVATDMVTYHLAEDDVAYLPREQAEVLCRRDKARELPG